MPPGLFGALWQLMWCFSLRVVPELDSKYRVSRGMCPRERPTSAGCQIFLHAPIEIHGGLEMGRGLRTKIRPVAAEGVGVSLDANRVMPTRTDNVSNTSNTAAIAAPERVFFAVRRAKTDRDTLAHPAPGAVPR